MYWILQPYLRDRRLVGGLGATRCPQDTYNLKKTEWNGSQWHNGVADSCESFETLSVNYRHDADRHCE